MDLWISWVFWFFLDFFLFRNFWTYLDFQIFFNFGFFISLRFCSKLLMLILKVTKVTTGHQKFPKMGQNSILSFFFPKGQKKPKPKAEALQEIEVDPYSKPYLLVDLIHSLAHHGMDKILFSLSLILY